MIVVNRCGYFIVLYSSYYIYFFINFVKFKRMKKKNKLDMLYMNEWHTQIESKTKRQEKKKNTKIKNIRL